MDSQVCPGEVILRLHTIVGIDPGRRGALALLNGQEHPVVWDMPPTLPELWLLLQELRVWSDRAVLERVHAMPGEGVVSVFGFGRGYGALEMGLVAAKFHVSLVEPAVWKAALGLTSDKTSSIELVKKLWPDWKAGRHDRREAVCLAHYGRSCL